ncbi:unnamed protein product, partial [Adineta steineri]
LQISTRHILVVTTFHQDITGSFTITATGMAPIGFSSINVSSNSSVVQSQYSSALNSDSTTYCRIGTFILVVTTYSPNVLGTFAIISYGPGPIQFIIQQQ